MHVVVKHVALPALAPAAVVGLYFTPVLLFGCVNRGWMALVVVLVSAVAACVTAGVARHAKARHQPSSNWWMISTLILTLPIVLVLGPLG
jgi:ABC-type amino acid transport system permease subunit